MQRLVLIFVRLSCRRVCKVRTRPRTVLMCWMYTPLVRCTVLKRSGRLCRIWCGALLRRLVVLVRRVYRC